MNDNLEDIFTSAMDLINDLKEYIENSKKVTSVRLPNPADITVSEEMSKITANMTSIVSWLFLFKALKNNEITEEVLIEEGGKVINSLREIPNKIDIEDYPVDYLKLKEQVSSLQKDVGDLYEDFIHRSVN